jgi:dihydrofolate reductase
VRNLIVTEFLSLDGVMENPSWTFPYWNDEIAAFKADETKNSDALLLGRATYEGFAAAWPKMSPEKEPLAPYMNGVRKYVVSATLDRVEWNNSVLLKGNLVEAVSELKRGSGQDIAVHGSAALAQTLMQHGLVDRLRLLVYPVVVGKGKHLFSEGLSATWELREAQAFSSGVVALVYEPEQK